MNTLRVKLLDQHQNPIQNCKFTLKSTSNTKIKKIATSSTCGTLCFYDLPYGNYILSPCLITEGVKPTHQNHHIRIKRNGTYIDCLKIDDYLTLTYETVDDNYMMFFETQYSNGIDYKSLIVNLSSAALSKIPYAGSFATAIFNTFCGVGTQNFGELYLQVREIIKEELTQKEIDDMNGELNGVIQDIKEYYNPAKSTALKDGSITDPSKRKELRELLMKELTHLNTLAGKLQMPRYKYVGFPTYLLVTLQKIIICQEMASIDTNLDPTKSSYVETIQIIATDAKLYANQTAMEIVNKRRSYINAECKFSFGIVQSVYFQIYDKFIKKDLGGLYVCPNASPCDSSQCANTKQRALNHVENARNDVQNQLYNSWAFPTWQTTIDGLHYQPLRPIS